MSHQDNQKRFEGDQSERLVSHNTDADFEGGQWINGEFFYKKQRQRPVQTKAQAIYGDDWEDSGRSRGGLESQTGRNIDYLQPMKFVSKGTINPGEDASAPASTEAVPMDTGTDDAAEEKSPAAPSAPPGIQIPASMQFKSFGRRAEDRQRRKRRGGIGSGPDMSAFAKPDKDFAKFEKHTKGVGLKLLMKMGFKGRLGKKEQGIAVPIQPKVRPKQMGMGYGEFAEQNETMRFRNREEEEKARAEEAKVKAETVSRQDNWKTDRAGKPKRKSKRQYKTAADLTREAMGSDQKEGGANTAEPQLIIDMRGPNVKVVNANKISEGRTDDGGWAPTREESRTSLPELQHNIRLLVDLIEADILKLDREKKHARDTVTALEGERDSLQRMVLKDRESVESMEAVIRLVESAQIVAAKHSKKLRHLSADTVKKAVDSIAAVFGEIQTKHTAHFRNSHIAKVAASTAFPFVKHMLSQWSPITKSEGNHTSGGAGAASRRPTTRQVVDILVQWKMLLHGESLPNSSLDCYESFLLHTFMPRMQLLVSMDWDFRSPSQLVDVLTEVQSVLTDSITQTVLHRLVVPMLKSRVKQWNPRTERVPIHQWIHPWLTLLAPTTMQQIYTDVRYKMGIALQDWHPSDGSAWTLISPWQNVFAKHDFDALIVRSIVPKLARVLQHEFVINPQNQSLAPFEWVCKWLSVVNTSIFVDLLRQHVFPKWFKVLHTWLQPTNNADLEEVWQWYAGWKSVFPAALRDDPRVKAQFSKALGMMNAAMDDPSNANALDAAYNRAVAELKESITDHTPLRATQGTPSARMPPPPPPRRKPAQPRHAPASIDAEFRETIEQLAQLKNITFVPNTRMPRQDGKQVYSFGKVNLYLQNGVVYVAERDAKTGVVSWLPTALDQLIARAEKLGVI